jgi:hypothetical protein
MPKSSNSQTQSKAKLGLKYILIIIILGFICGFLFPVRMFRKDGFFSFIASADYNLPEEN